MKICRVVDLGAHRLWRGLGAAAAAGRRAQGGSCSRRAAALRTSARDHARPQRQARASARFRRAAAADGRRVSSPAIAAATSPITGRDKWSAIRSCNLGEIRRDVGWYVRQLEEAMIRRHGRASALPRFACPDARASGSATRRRRTRTRSPIGEKSSAPSACTSAAGSLRMALPTMFRPTCAIST